MPKDKTKKDKSEIDALKITEGIVDELLTLIGSSAKTEIAFDEDNDAVVINIQTEDEAGLLIGTRGETIRSLQTIIGMIFKNKTGEWQRIIVNVADWIERQKEKLSQLAANTAERVKESGEAIPLYNLSPADRRIVHMALKDNSDVITQSIGEGQDRHLIVSPKES